MSTHRKVRLLSLLVTLVGALAMPQSARADGFDDDDPAKCDVGGPGATSCSIGQGGNSCSVTCSSGTIACCKYGFSLPDCNCISAT
jgi:hypothetical protein